ncbi:hypothetical protein BUZ06_04655 [Staphylococcus gallinarum]|nr:hypothetical protein BUZ13_13895 [Staphylococcus gallinarum]PTK94608.1 hypothetical protein BUZ05_04670 [Staphylococcus gallinarum]RIO89637.1 hypothetical protein BUZ06_04655 [Staphylococcus gallinarum]
MVSIHKSTHELGFIFGVSCSFVIARFPRGQLQPVVFSLSCSLRSLANKTSSICLLITNTSYFHIL